MDRLSGLIRPPKDLVFKLNSVVKGAIARYLLQVREERQLGLFDYNDVTEIEWILEDLNSLIDGVQDGSLELKSVQNTFEFAKDILSNESMKKISFSNNSFSFFYPDVILSRIRDIDIEDLFQNTEGYRSKIEEIEEFLTVVLDEVKKRSQDIIFISNLKEYQEAVSYLERRFDEVDSNTWYVTKKGFNPVVLKFKEKEEGARGTYFFSKETQQHVITFRMPLQLDKSSISDAFRKVNGVIKHELIHACQKQIAINRGIEEAGLPRSKRNKKFLQHNKQEEKKLKKKMKQQGIDPDLVEFHALDDIEFYTRIMDEIRIFKNHLIYQKPLNEQIRSSLRRNFFQVLKTHQPNKYKKAVGLFVEQANKEYYEQNKKSKGTKRAYSSSNIVSKVAMKFLQSATRDDPKMKNTGHGGLDTWFSGHGGGTKDKATWGDWISITPVDHTITKEDGSKKEYEAGDIVGPCGISGKKEWASVTDGGKRPLKCMPRAKAYQMPKKDRASLAQKKQEEEKKHNGQKPVNTPTFSQEAKKMLKKSDFYRVVSPPDQLSSFSTGTPVGDSENPDGVNDHSALPNGNSARNIGRPSPDSPNLKYRNLDKSEANGRRPANKLDLGYVHDSGSGSARVIPYDSGFVNNSSALRKASDSASDFQRELESEYEGLTLFLSDYTKGDEYSQDIVQLHSIVFPREKRKQGFGSKVMLEITLWADKNNKIISLTPSKDFGGSSVSRLVRFYSQFGFKKNKGRNKDYRTSDTMIRYPKSSIKRASRPVRIDKKTALKLTNIAWNKVLKYAQEAEKKGLYNISKVIKPVPAFEVGSFMLRDREIDVIALIDSERGGSFDNSHSLITINIEDSHINILSEVARKFIDFEKKFKSKFFSTLIHEMTHAYDRTFYYKGTKGTLTRKPKTREEIIKYLNSGTEIKAHLQQIASESEEFLRQKYGLTRNSIRKHFNESLNQQGSTWVQKQYFFSPKNKKYIKNAVLTYLLEQAGI
jgi:hypothetical protein